MGGGRPPNGIRTGAVSPGRSAREQQAAVAWADPEAPGAVLRAACVPDGWHLWGSRVPAGATDRSHRPWVEGPVIGGRTAEETLAAARALYAGAAAEQIERQAGTLAVWFVSPRGAVVRRVNKPSPIVPAGF